jgi:hypothetical protein
MKLKGLALNDLVTITLAFVLIGVVGAIGLYINASVNTTAGFTTSSNGLSYWAIQNASTGMSTLLQWLPLIAVIVAAGIVIAVLVSAFAMRREGV